ncbi:hypothetical protein PIB30_007620 [Stylosanthes scabra]|uniref:Uncharacterized protein n=1 Tax=Stylosanthes scabra TaxID=79078 RepID=A0ABU6V6Q6_9FABA|nr:hypothetical protein [Stylosanthes scabra]
MEINNWMVQIEHLVGSIDHGEVQTYSICTIPDELREPKKDAYIPKLVSVGPLHRGATRQLDLMEEPKLRYLKNFLQRQGSLEEGVESASMLGDRLSRCGIDVLNMDTVIRACYGGDLKLGSHELTKIMMVDGCFLLEFLLRLEDYLSLQQEERDKKYSEDPFFAKEKKVISVLNDVTMMENQIPLVVLKKLYRKVYHNGSEMKDDHQVVNLVRRTFGYQPQNNSCAAHILHLMHSFTVHQGQQIQKGVKPACKELKRCATTLLAAGISIIPTASSNSNAGNNGNIFVDKFDFHIIFNSKDAVLEIPPLLIKKTTEVRWRNLIALEQTRIWIRCKYTSYALFFRGLICCKHDIEWLEKKGVIVNESNMSNEELLKMFRSLSKGAEHMDSSYSELCERLNKQRVKQVTQVLLGLITIIWHYCWRFLEVTMFYLRNSYRILIRDHIPTVWKFLAVVAATALLILTIMQTYYSSGSSGK